MTEYLPYVLAALPVLLGVGWYCRRWGFDDGHAEGHAAGYLKGMADQPQGGRRTSTLADGPKPGDDVILGAGGSTPLIR